MTEAYMVEGPIEKVTQEEMVTAIKAMKPEKGDKMLIVGVKRR